MASKLEAPQGAAEAIARDAAGPIFPFWAAGATLSLLLRRGRLPSPIFGFLVFAGYWLLPLLLTGAQGSWLDPAQLAAASAGGKPRLPLLLWRLLAGGYGGEGRMTYLVDRTHLLFGLLLGIGACFGAMVLRRIDGVAASLERQRLGADRGAVAQAYARFRALGNHRLLRLVSLLLGAATLLLFLRFHEAARYAYWWGSSVEGSAGLAFAVIEGAMVYHATQGVFLVGAASLMLGQLGAQAELRPFHPDGCNGLARLGMLVMLLWVLALVAAGAIYIVLALGYLGLERTQLAWALVILATLAMPFIAIIPLNAAVRAIAAARDRQLALIEPVLASGFARDLAAVERGAAGAAEPAGDLLARAKENYDLLRGVNIWPFNPQALTLLMSAYALQALLTLHEFLGEWPTEFFLQ